MRFPPRQPASVAALAALLVLTGCGSDGETPDPQAQSAPTSEGGAGVTIRVPAEAKTINEAMAQAKPGDIVLVFPGTYAEEVKISTERVTLRGTDRNKVIIDGGVIRPNGITVTAAGVTVQNLTVRNALLNGVLVTGQTDPAGEGTGRGSDGYTKLDLEKFPPLQRFLVDHVTSYNNGLYGIYAFDSQHGTIRDTYTSGHPDSGLYVGQCKPCDIAVYDNVAERNAVGYEGANASGGVFVYRNRLVGNRVGLTTNSDHQEALVPQAGADIVGNLIAANDEKGTPAQADGGFGIGVGIAGGTRNTIARNLIVNNPGAGVVLTNADDLAPIDNKVQANSFDNNGTDVVYSASAAAAGSGNCLQGSAGASVVPKDLPGCDAAGAVKPGTLKVPASPKGIAFTDVKAPPEQPNLPDAETAPAPDLAALPGRIDLASIKAPTAQLLADRSSVRW